MTRAGRVAEVQGRAGGDEVPVRRRGHDLLASVYASLAMTLWMTFLLTAIHRGFARDFGARWLVSFLLSYPLAFGLTLFVLPGARSAADRRLRR